MGDDEPRRAPALRWAWRRAWPRGPAALLAVAMLALACSPAPLEPLVSAWRSDPISDVARDLDRMVPPELRAARVPGLALALVRDGEVVLERFYGVRRRGGAPVTSRTTFAAASLSKPLVAYAALRRVDAGELALDGPLDAELDAPFLRDPAQEGVVTLRHVLSHSAGLSNLVIGSYVDRRLQRPPGERFAYSGNGFAYLQRVLEAQSGVPLDVLMRPELDELGMQRSGFLREEIDPALHATPHVQLRMPVLLFGGLGLLVAAVVWALAAGATLASGAKFGPALRLLPGLAATALVSGLAGHLLGLGSALTAVAVVAAGWAGGALAWLALRRVRSRSSLGASGAGGLASAVVVVALLAWDPVIPSSGAGMREPHAAGTLRTTAADYARFVAALLEGRGLQGETVAAMLSPQARVNERTAWGLGIGLQHGEHGDSFWQWGQSPGWEALVVGHPASGSGVVVLTNGGPVLEGLGLARRVAHVALGGDHLGYWLDASGF